MSAERKEWGTEELELLQYVKAHNATAKNEYLTRLFNEKNGRKRTPDAIRFRLKRLRKLARESAAKRFGPERSGTQPRDSTNTRNGADPRNKITIIIPRHPLIISRQLRDATSLCGCDKLSTRLQSNQQLAFTSRPSPRDDDLDWYLELPNKLRKIVIE
ncbi:hypothetical protein VE00_06392 [Pseudogymnoascus sp. WSF 3629]|nr:hypothetical protein VE00_06392 [Pseudogymnoascus sp. WSF 3629]